MRRLVLVMLIAASAFAFGKSQPRVTSPAQLDWGGFWWEKLDASFKLGWVSGYVKAMDLAGGSYAARCMANMPLYVKEWPTVDPKVILKTMCSSDDLDFDGIAMGQFVDGMDAFYRDYRNKQLEVGWAIQYARDSIKGRPAQELDAEVALWRRCTAATKSQEDAVAVSKACAPDAK